MEIKNNTVYLERMSDNEKNKKYKLGYEEVS